MRERDRETGSNFREAQKRKIDTEEEGKEPLREAETVRDRETGREQKMG